MEILDALIVQIMSFKLDPLEKKIEALCTTTHVI